MAFEEEEAEGSEEELSPCSEKPSQEWSGGEMRTMHEPAPSSSQTSIRNELQNKTRVKTEVHGRANTGRTLNNIHMALLLYIPGHR
ncbi:unnamed protein product [Gadus morhua 'NCC']